MKGTILIIFLSGINGLMAQIPNSSFENWTNESPVSWQTTNIPILPASVIADSDAYIGFLSAKGIVVSNNNNQPFPPYLGLTGGSYQGFLITHPYDVAEGWCKLFLQQGDIFKGYVQVYSLGSDPVASGTLVIDSSISDWTHFSILINYFMPTFIGNCTLYFTITDSTELSSGHIGSYFKVDDLSMSGTAGIEFPGTEEAFSVFPNPVQDLLHLNFPDENDLAYRVYDNLGRIVLKKDHCSPYETIITNDLSPGIYFVKLETSGKKIIKKVIVE
jgi:hypothetical protein